MSPRLVLTAVVFGTPAPQGSKKAFATRRGSKALGTLEYTGKVSVMEMSKKVGPWRAAVAEAIQAAVRSQIEHDRWEGVLMGPAEVRITFALPRPKSVSVNRRPWPCVTPDLDKVVRSTLDGITMGGVWKDDALAVRVVTEKLYAGAHGALESAGAVIEIWTLDGITPAALAATIPALTP
ncbi:RusA family crossover junction endodeoxyribonuclease [Microbispora rosea]|uniref:RusA family crossover junction endodeoxyribonuclease n=1 Tax=Microbispora rosea TaxID=58117 RepID=UPI003799E59E